VARPGRRLARKIDRNGSPRGVGHGERLTFMRNPARLPRRHEGAPASSPSHGARL